MEANRAVDLPSPTSWKPAGWWLSDGQRVLLATRQVLQQAQVELHAFPSLAQWTGSVKPSDVWRKVFAVASCWYEATASYQHEAV